MYGSSWIQLLSALGVPVALLIAIGSAWWQSMLQRRQLKHTEFEMRFAVYETVRAFVRDVCKTFEIEFAEIVKFGNETSHAEFLFKRPVQEFIQNVFTKANDLWIVTEALRSCPTPDQERLNELHRLQAWFVTAYETTIRSTFTCALKLYDEPGRSRSIWASMIRILWKPFRFLRRNKA
jgi:hypothetical protein